MMIWRKMVSGWLLVHDRCVDGDLKEEGVGMVVV